MEGTLQLLMDRRLTGLETPLAKIEAWNPSSGDNYLFLLTEDHSAGAGSYNGLATNLLQISDGAFHYVKATNATSHQERPIRLLKSLKSDWRIASPENETEILMASCLPRDNGSFVIDYTRYRIDGTQWFEYKREVDGFGESDRSFPERSAFP